MLATPRIEGDNADQVGIKTKVIEVTEVAMDRIGMDALKAERTESSLQHVVAADQVDALLKELEGTEGAKLLAESNMLTADGRQAQVQTVDEQVIDGAKQSLGPVIDIVPVISADKKAIDVTLQAGVNRLNASAK